jgi:hypothetical protein
LSDKSENSYCKFVHVRSVTANELDVAVLKAKEEFSVSTQTVQLCDHERGFESPALSESLSQLRTFGVGLLAAFHFDELADHLPLLIGNVTTDGLVLGFKTKT